MTQHIFKSGDLVLVKTRVGRKELHLIGTFQAMQTKTRAIVHVPGEKMDDDGIRLVEMRSLKPYYNHPSDQQRRARNAARRYKQGVRIFRLDKPEGRIFCVQTIDLDTSVAVGHVAKRKTVQIVPLHSLFPALQ